jgi:hypothetical protein
LDSFWGDAARLIERVHAAGSKVLDSLAHEGEPGRRVALLVPQEGKLNLEAGLARAYE